MRLILTGGGTAGHVYPLLAVFEELQKQSKDKPLVPLYVGSASGMEQEILKNHKIPAVFIYSGKWRRYWKKWWPALFLNLRDLFLILLGFFQALFVILKFKPDKVFAKGGYVTIPMVLAARICGIPVIIHESDLVMGLSNQLCSRLAQKICLAFPLRYYQNLPRKKIIYTGNPIRQEFIKIKKEERQEKGETVLVMGGSQGSKVINQAIYPILPQLLKRARVIHIVGNLDFQRALDVKKSLPKDLKERYTVYDFVKDKMAFLMAEADLVVSRSGANTIFEIAALGKPSVLIPLVWSANEHQAKNASIFQSKKASVVIEEGDLSERLLEVLVELLGDKKRLKLMGKAAKELSRVDASAKIAHEILTL